MRLKALDTIRVSNAVPKGRKEEGDEFTINKEEGAELVRRGLAVEVKAKRKPANKARSGAPKNKGN